MRHGRPAVLTAALLCAALVLCFPARASSPRVLEEQPAGNDGRSAQSAEVGGSAAQDRPLRGIKPPIHDWTIPFPPQRLHQTAAYSERHYGERQWRLRRVELIVEHMAATGSARAVHDTFAANMPDVEFGELPGVCAHYLVATNGRIYRLVPLRIRCRHVVGLNHLSIGIEHLGHTPSDVLDNPRQLRASLRLTRWLRCRYALPPKRVIGHAESLSSPFYKELVPSFRGQTHGDWRPTYMHLFRTKLRRTTCPNG
jgi:N-acetylmuramoyl-L-alanine amidase